MSQATLFGLSWHKWFAICLNSQTANSELKPSVSGLMSAENGATNHRVFLISFIKYIFHPVTHINQQMHVIALQNVRKVYKLLLHVSAARRPPQQVSTTQQLKHKYITVETQNEILGYIKC